MGKKKDKKNRDKKPPVETALDFRAVERSAAREASEKHPRSADAPDGVSGFYS